MTLNGAKLICLDENGEQGEVIEAKGRSFTFGYYINSDCLLKSTLAKNVHCEINCDAFGRVTIRNHCPDNPVRVNGSIIYLKRPLLSGSRIKVLDKEYLWTMEKNSAQDEPSTPNNNVTKPEQAPNSCPNLVPHKDTRSRLTIHSFGYSIKSDEHGNKCEDDDNNDLEDENFNDLNEEAALLMDQESSSDKENECISKILAVKQKNNENKEMIKINNINKHLLKFNQSDVLITSFSPRETGIKIEKSFTALMKPSVTTPKSLHGTPRKVLSEIHDDASMDLMKFSTPSTSRVTNPISKNTSMHLLDLTTPTKLTPASKSVHKSLGRVNKRQPYIDIVDEEESPLSTESDSVISVDSSSSNEVVISECESTPAKGSPLKKTLTTTPKRTPQSLRMRTLIASAKKQANTARKLEVIPQSPTNVNASMESTTATVSPMTPRRKVAGQLQFDEPPSVPASNKNINRTPKSFPSRLNEISSPKSVRCVKNLSSNNTSQKLPLVSAAITTESPCVAPISSAVGIPQLITQEPKPVLGVPPLSAIIKPSLSETILKDFHSNSSSYDQKKSVLFAGKEIGEKKIVKKFYSPLKRRNQILVVSKISPVSVAKHIEFVPKKNTQIVDAPNLNVISNLSDTENKSVTVSEQVSKPVDESKEIISISESESFPSIKGNHIELPEDGISPLNVTFSPVKENGPKLNETFSPVKAESVIDVMNVTFSPIKKTKNESVTIIDKELQPSNDAVPIPSKDATFSPVKDSIISPAKQVITSPPKLNETFSSKDRETLNSMILPVIEFDNKNEKKTPLMPLTNIIKENVELINESPIIEKTPKKQITKGGKTKSNSKKTNDENRNLNMITEAELKNILQIPNTQPTPRSKIASLSQKTPTSKRQPKLFKSAHKKEIVRPPINCSTPHVKKTHKLITSVKKDEDIFNNTEEGLEMILKTPDFKKLNINSKNDNYESVGLLPPKIEVLNEDDLDIEIHVSPEKVFDKLIGKHEIKRTYTRKPNASFNKSDVLVSTNLPISDIQDWVDSLDDFQEGVNSRSVENTSEISANISNFNDDYNCSKLLSRDPLAMTNITVNETVKPNSPVDSEISGLHMLDQTVESIFSEPLAVSETSVDDEILEKSANKIIENVNVKAEKEKLELEEAFINFKSETKLTTDGVKRGINRPQNESLGLEFEKPQAKIFRMTLGNRQEMDTNFDLNAEKQKLELERAFENFEKEPTIQGTDRKVKTPEPEKPQSKISRMTLGNRQEMDTNFDLNAEKQKLELERAFENFEKEPTIQGTDRKVKTPEPEKPQSKISRMTLGNRQEMDTIFDLNAEKQKLELERAFENFEKEPTIQGTDRKVKTPEPEKPQSKISRMTLGNRQEMDTIFDLNAEKQKLELERAFENFEKEPTIPGTDRKVKTPEPEKPQSKISRMTLGNRQEIDTIFDLNAEKQKLELERAFENFEKEPTVQGTDRQVKTPEPEKPQSKISRMTLGNRQEMDTSFDLNAEKQKLELERAFENFEKEPTIQGTDRKVKTPEPEKPQSKISRMTLGNRQEMDTIFDLNAEKQKLELERAFENFEKEPTIPGTDRKVKTPEPEKPQSKISRMTLGNRQEMDTSFDLNAEKQKLELERAFENFEKEPTIPGTDRKVKTPEPEKPQSKISRMTLGNRQEMDTSFDLNAEKQKLELERAFENFEKEPTIPGTDRKVKTPEPEKPQSKISRMTLGNRQELDTIFDLNAEKQKLELRKVPSSPSGDVCHNSIFETLTTSSKSLSPKGKQCEADLEVSVSVSKNLRLRKIHKKTTVVSTRTTRRGRAATKKVNTDLDEDDAIDSQNQKSEENFKNPADMETSTPVLKQPATRKGRAAGKKIIGDPNVADDNQQQPETIHLNDSVLDDGSNASVSVPRNRRARRLITIDMDTSTPVLKRPTTRKGRAAGKKIIGDPNVADDNQQQPETIHLNDSVLDDGSNASVSVPRNRRPRRLATIDDEKKELPKSQTVRQTTRKGRSNTNPMDDTISQKSDTPVTIVQETTRNNVGKQRKKDQLSEDKNDIPKLKKTQSIKQNMKRRSGDELEAETHTGNSKNRKKTSSISSDSQIHVIEDDVTFTDNTDEVEKSHGSTKVQKTSKTTHKGRTAAQRKNKKVEPITSTAMELNELATAAMAGVHNKSTDESLQMATSAIVETATQLRGKGRGRGRKLNANEIELEIPPVNVRDRTRKRRVVNTNDENNVEDHLDISSSSSVVAAVVKQSPPQRKTRRQVTKGKTQIVEKIEIDLCSTSSDAQVAAIETAPTTGEQPKRVLRGRGAAKKLQELEMDLDKENDKEKAKSEQSLATAITDNKNDSGVSQQKRAKRTTRKK